MSTGRRIAQIALVAALIVGALSCATAAEAGRVDGTASGDTINLSAFQARQVYEAALRVDPALLTTRYMRAPQCNIHTGGAAEPGAPVGPAPVDGGDLPPCGSTNATITVPTCVDGPAILPLWRQTRASVADSWAGLPWTLTIGYSCPEDAVPTMTAEDFRRLPLPPPVLRMQPDQGWVLVNIDTIVLTDPTEQTFRTELLGYGVDVLATPTTYHYDFGDDLQDLVTHSPGHEWPHQDTVHVYETTGTRQITLTTTWTGRYRVDGTSIWRDINGTASTTVTGTPFEVQERRAHLVSGLCTDIPKPADC